MTTTPLVLLLLSLLSLTSGQAFWQDPTWPATTYVLTGQNFTIQAKPINNTKIYWRRGRDNYGPDYIPSKWIPVSHEGNCSYQPAMMHRITQCDTNLTIINTTRYDEGYYFYRAKANKSMSVYYTHRVIMVDLKPTLGILKLTERSVSLRCDDLANNNSRLKIETWDLEHNGWVIDHNHHTKEFSVGGHTAQPILWKARCCATNAHLTKCGPWRKINHDKILCNPRARGRNWCKARGNTTLLNSMNFHSLIRRPLPAGICQRSVFSVNQNNTKLMLCNERPQTILGPQGASEWYKYRFFGGLQSVSNTSKFEIRFASYNYTGLYRVESPDSVTNFSIEVEAELKATVEPLRVYDNKVAVNCTHNGPKHNPIVTWEVIGTYEKTEINGPQLTLYPDCWLNYSKWYFKFALRCHVRDGPWFTSSDWFIGEATRAGGECNRYNDSEED